VRTSSSVSDRSSDISEIASVEEEWEPIFVVQGFLEYLCERELLVF